MLTICPSHALYGQQLLTSMLQHVVEHTHREHPQRKQPLSQSITQRFVQSHAERMHAAEQHCASGCRPPAPSPTAGQSSTATT